MQSSIKSDWSLEELQSYISDLEKTDPKKAEDFRQDGEGFADQTARSGV